MSYRAFAWAMVMVFVAGCAIQEAPPGGPEDKTPPKIVATFPAPDSAGVAPDSEIRFAFSEKMTRTRLERSVTFSPPVKIRSARWQGNTIHLLPEEPLHGDTTYIVQLKGGYSDFHRVRNDADYEFAFATSAHIDSGTIGGRVLFRRKPSEKAVVRLFALPRDSAFSPSAARPDRETMTGGDGTYELRYLPSAGESFAVWAFQDVNGNGSFDRDNDVGQDLSDTLLLDAERYAIASHDLFIVDPKEPAEISGVVKNETGIDTAFVSVAAHAVGDSIPPTAYTICAQDGSFRMPLLKGTYVLYAFHDVQLDSLCGTYPCGEDSLETCVEPCVVLPESLIVAPGAKIQLPEIVLGAVQSTEDP